MSLAMVRCSTQPLGHSIGCGGDTIKPKVAEQRPTFGQ
jgi:hypothetical protein